MAKEWSKRWKRVSSWWGKLNPPWTPSKGEYKIYDNYFKRITDFKNKNRSILIFGATALVRELADKYGYKTTLIDINPEMVKDQTKFLGRRIKGERVIIGDWLKVDKIFKNQKFDVIAGDHAIINVRFNKWPRVYRNMQKVLKPGGYVLWATTVYGHKKPWSLDDLINNYRPGLSMVERFWHTYKMFGDPKFHDKKYGFHFGKLNIAFHKKAKGRLTPAQIKDAMIVDLPPEWVSVILPQKKFEQFNKKYFKIVARKRDTGHPFYQYQQLYLLRVD